jgi:hypothetical protein
MKISEFLQDLFEKTGTIFGGNVISNDYMLTSEMLKIPQIKEGLLKCEEFQNTKELIIMDGPIMEIELEDDKTKSGHSVPMMLFENVKFKEKVYLYSIFLAPTIWEAEDYMKPVKDDICVTPIMHDPITFTPKQGITVFINTAELHVLEGADEDYKKALIEKFKNALDNPDEYIAKEKRVIMMRLLVEESVELPEKKEFDYVVLPKKQFVQL